MVAESRVQVFRALSRATERWTAHWDACRSCGTRSQCAEGIRLHQEFARLKVQAEAR